jgi:predicted enzyme related to lactoylglutathione lyase
LLAARDLAPALAAVIAIRHGGIFAASAGDRQTSRPRSGPMHASSARGLGRSWVRASGADRLPRHQRTVVRRRHTQTTRLTERAARSRRRTLAPGAGPADAARMTDTNTGRFVWYELLTSDVEGAIAFYTDVAGWTSQKWETGDYTMWVASQGPLGGVTRLPDAAKQMGAPPYWQANVQVANVDKTVEEVKRLGGQVHVVEDIPTVGRFAVIADPQGAVIAVFTPASDMQSHDVAKPGEFSWHELYTTDYEAAFAFYQKIAGWERLGEFDMGAMGKYLLWGRGGKQLGGMMTMPPGMKTPDGRTVPPSWMFYITTADLDAALGRAKARGARVINGPMEVPGGQRIVQLMDPQGAAFALVTPPTA